MAQKQKNTNFHVYFDYKQEATHTCGRGQKLLERDGFTRKARVGFLFPFKKLAMIVIAVSRGQWLYILNDINSLWLHVSTSCLIQPERQTHLLSYRPGFKSLLCHLPAEVSSSLLPLQVGNSDTPFNSGLSQHDISSKDSSFPCMH